MSFLAPWSYPDERYYYGWVDAPVALEPSDGEVKSAVIGRLHLDPHTKDENIRVDVKQKVVILGGEVSSWVAKRAAGDDAWDTPGVLDVSNILTVRQPSSAAASTQ
jgi:osmotically-inducible protein OsmY